MIKQGDCKTELRKIESNSIDLIYLDPPFFTQKKQSQKTRDNSKEYTFDDSWESVESYRSYIEERLIECSRVLKKTGSIFLHCDRSASHHLRISLDNVFGANNFQSEIIWTYKRWSNAKKGLLNSHQAIYFYSKTADFKFNHIFEDYSPTTNIDQIFQKRMRDANGKTKYKPNAVGGYELIQDKKGVPLSDVWDIPYLNPKANERVGYPTQKPILLLEKVIQLVTDEGDIVLDIGANDGTLLSFYPKNCMKVGCEPATNLAEELKKNADVSINDFWDYSKYEQIFGDKKAKIITAIGMFYDMDDPNQFVRDVRKALAPDGVFIAQMMTLKNMVDQNDVGNICHEHLEYYSYKSLRYLFQNNGLEITKIEENDINGGSYRIFARHIRCGSIRHDEPKIDFNKFVDRVKKNKDLTREFIKSKVFEGKKVYWFGASTKSNTLLQYYGLSPSEITAIAEINPKKFGLYTVGTGIPIVSEEEAIKKVQRKMAMKMQEMGGLDNLLK